MKKRGWLKEMQFLRGAACIGVVVAHSIVQPHTTPLMDIVNHLLTIVVPVFLFLSAFLAFYKSPNGTPRGYLGKHLPRVGIPYVLWINLYTWIPVLTGIAQPPALPDYLTTLVGGAFHLYFIPIVLQFYLVFTLNRFEWFRRFLYTPQALAGSLALTLGMQIMFSSHYREVFPDFYLTFPAWCFYFVLGAWAARWWEPIREWLTRPGRTAQLALLLPPGLYCTVSLPQAASFQPLVQIAVLLILPCLLTVACRAPLGTMLEPIARHSFGIYLIHRLPFNQFQHLYASLDPYTFFLTSLILQGGIGYGLTLLLTRLPALGWTVGARIRHRHRAQSSPAKTPLPHL